MADTYTANYGFTKPEPGTSGWDAKLNALIDALDQVIHGWGWEPVGVGGTVLSPGTQIVINGNVLADHPTGKRIKIVGATSGTHYGTVNGGSFGSGDTTLLVALESGALTVGEVAQVYRTVMPNSNSPLPHGLHRASENASYGYVLEWTGQYFLPKSRKILAGAYAPGGGGNVNLNSDSLSKLIGVDSAGVARTVMLPQLSTVGVGDGYTIMKTDAAAFAITVDGNGAETINGAATYVLNARYSCVTVVSDGTEWKIISSR